MGELIQFRPRASDAIEIQDVHVIPPDVVRALGAVPAGARILSANAGIISPTAQSISANGVTIYYEIERDQDTAPSEYCAPET